MNHVRAPQMQTAPTPADIIRAEQLFRFHQISPDDLTLAATQLAQWRIEEQRAAYSALEAATKYASTGYYEEAELVWQNYADGIPLREMNAFRARIVRAEQAVAPLVEIADAFDANNLDDEARKFSGPNLEKENPRAPDQIELYCGRGGKQLLTLAHCLAARALMKDAKPKRDIAAFWKAQAKWSQATFGSDAERGPVGPLKHLAKEAVEAQQNPADLMEFVDCLFLTFDATRRAGFTLEQLLVKAWEKLEINKARKWVKPASGDSPVEHDRTLS